MLDSVPGSHAKAVVADKAYDTADFNAACRERKVTPHVHLLSLLHCARNDRL
jgi:IS5 family transposase